MELKGLEGLFLVVDSRTVCDRLGKSGCENRTVEVEDCRLRVLALMDVARCKFPGSGGKL